MTQIAAKGVWSLHRVQGRVAANGGGMTSHEGTLYKYIEFNDRAFTNVLVTSEFERFVEPGREGLYYIAIMDFGKAKAAFLTAYKDAKNEEVYPVSRAAKNLSRAPLWLGVAALLATVFLIWILIGFVTLFIGVWQLNIVRKLRSGAAAMEEAVRADLALMRQSVSLSGDTAAVPAVVPAG